MSCAERQSPPAHGLVAASTRQLSRGTSFWISKAKATTVLDTRNALRSRRIIVDPATSLPTVCNACQKLFQGARELARDSIEIPAREWRGIGDLHAKIRDLYRAAHDGCYVCDFIVKSTRGTSVTDYHIQTGQILKDGSDRFMTIIVAYKKGDPKVLHLWPRSARHGDFETLIDQASAAQSYTGSIETLALAARWLDSCRRLHKRCQHNVLGSWLPTRLLLLRNGRATLIETASRSSNNGPYATLSHCWGGKPFENLTSTTYTFFQKGVPITDFPASFRHAMEVCLSLGIHLLWIDSFCIIQGLDEAAQKDWEIESVQMTQVYANGILNIAAARAQKPEDGCYAERTAQIPSPILPCAESPGKCITIEKSPDIVVRHGTLSLEIKNEPLWARAWVFQESLVCRRLLQFGGSQIRWSCAQSQATELASRHMGPVGTFFGPGPEQFAQSHNRDHAWGGWQDLVAVYTRKALTYPSKDKLRAFQAAIERAEQVFGVEIFWGHSVDNLLESLRWQIALRSPKGIRIEPEEMKQAPSWSWASIDDAITYGGVQMRLMESSNIRGHLLSIVVLPQRWMLDNMVHYKHHEREIVLIGRVLQVSLLDNDPAGVQNSYVCHVGTSQWNLEVNCDTRTDLETVRNKSRVSLWLLATSPSLFGTPPTARQKEVYYWVLALMSEERGTFRRFGIARASVGTMAELNSGNEGRDEGSFLGYRFEPTKWYEAYRKVRPQFIFLA